MNLHSLATNWRRQVDSPFVPDEVRRAVEACAADLESFARDQDNALLSPKEAAKECGLKPATIRKRLSDGRLPNEGGKGRPKVRRAALRQAMSDGVANRLELVR